MAGLTRQGLTIKTLDEVIADYRTEATAVFSDLVPAGDTVDTGEESAIGRMIGVISPATAQLWEMIQEVNNAFNPAAARGISLDNIVALSGINRLAAQPTRAQCVFEGDYGVVISSPLGKCSSSLTRRTFSIMSPVILNNIGASGIGIDVLSVQDATTYTFSYSTDGVNFIDATITSQTPATRENILADLKQKIEDLFSTTFTTYYQDDTLFVSRIDPFQVVTFTLSVNLSMVKVRKLGVVQDDEVGPFAQEALSIDTISIPITGWDTVINPVAATTGRYTETDEQLRERWRNSKFVQSQNILESILDALRNVEGVTDVIIYENDTDITDPLGVPPHSFLPIVLGGLPTDVAQAIWQNKPIGVHSVGTTTIQITDSQSLPHDVSFQTPTEVPIYVSVNISDTGGLPGDAESLIRQNIVNMADTSLFIGDSVIYSRLYTPVNAVPGHQVNSLTVGTAPSPTGMANIAIAFDQVAQFSPENIIVTIT